MARFEISEVDIAPAIDHTLLIPTATMEQVDQWCASAESYHFYSVCVHPCHVKRAVERLYHSRVKVTTVVGFPLGTSTAETKLYEAMAAVDHGAAELDVKLNLTLLKDRDTDALHAEIAHIVEETHVPIKAILETALLTDAEKKLLSEICIDAGVAFLKTSTGWTQGATVNDVKMLWELTQGKIGVKASGGIRTVEQALEMLRAGASRLGTSFGIDMMTELQRKPREV